MASTAATTGLKFSTGAQGRVAAGDVNLAFEWWPGPAPLVCVHGLTSHRRAFAPLAAELAPTRGVLSFDLRGRGESDKPDGPYGIGQHASDLAQALDRLGVTEPVVLAGHSLGAFIVSWFAAQFPERTKAVILVDGGHFPAIPPGTDPDVLLQLVLGSFITRLETVAPSVDDVLASWAASPLYKDRVDDAVREYVEFDLEPVTGGVRGRATVESARLDYRDLLTNAAIPENLGKITCPALLLRAPGGLTGVGDAVINDAIRDEMVQRIRDLKVVDLPGENHHTILTTRQGAHRTAEAVTAFLADREL